MITIAFENMGEESLRPKGLFTDKPAELFALAEKETPKADIPMGLAADNGKILNLPAGNYGLLTASGWAKLATCQGVAVKVFLWACLNARPTSDGKLEVYLAGPQQKAVAKVIGCHPQSVINAVKELKAAHLVRRVGVGLLRLNPAVGGQVVV